jgi:hypothetical protein
MDCVKSDFHARRDLIVCAIMPTDTSFLQVEILHIIRRSPGRVHIPILTTSTRASFMMLVKQDEVVDFPKDGGGYKKQDTPYQVLKI